MHSIESHRAVQAVAKSVLMELAASIGALDTERSIAHRAVAMMAERGLADTWYYDCPAFVLLGTRSCLSISGAAYVPAEEPVGDTSLVTVDLSPSKDGIWGDCARSFVVEGGRCVEQPVATEFTEGIEAERVLHQQMAEFARPGTSFGELFEFANAAIAELGFDNLDFLGNVGHSIESVRSARRFIESGNAVRLGDVELFTFEPHIRKQGGGRWGFKHENIYAFGLDGIPVAL